jgi:alpha-glucosidase
MQWSAGPQAGFTSGRPWLPVACDHEIVNVAAQREDPTSMLALHARLIALRRAEPALSVGSFEIIRTPSDVAADVLTYCRGGSFLVALNLGGRTRHVPLPRSGSIVVSTHLDRAGERAGDMLALRPDEGLILRLSSTDGAANGD